jgi:hypothetical protein
LLEAAAQRQQAGAALAAREQRDVHVLFVVLGWGGGGALVLCASTPRPKHPLQNIPPTSHINTHTKTHLAGGLGHVASKRELLK